MPRRLVIMNPAARGEKAIRVTERIRQLAKHDSILFTSGPREARAIALDATLRGEFDVIVAAGGDGTINEVANGIAGSTVQLGILPAGTMNVFAAELGLPKNLDDAWKVICEGHTREIDLPRAGENYFVQMGGIGLDAQIVEETSREVRKTFGPLSYAVSMAQIAARTPPIIQIETPERSEVGSFVLVGNGRYYGGPFVFFRDAAIDDGKLDVMVFKNLSYLDIFRYLQAIIFQNHYDLHDVEYFQTTSLKATSEERLPVEVDGELIGRLPMEFGFSERKLRVLVPAT